MNKTKKFKLEHVVMIIIIFLLFLFCFNLYHKKIVNYQFKFEYKELKNKNIKIKYPFFKYRKLDKKITEIITFQFADLKGNIDSKATIIDNKYLSILFIIKEKDRNIDYQSYFFDLKTIKRIPLNTIIKKSKYQEFENIINTNLYSKYPKFIVDSINNSKTGKRSFFIKNHEIEFYYTNYEITPQINEEISLKINYNELKDIIVLSNYKLDKNYKNENVYKIDNNKKLVVFGFDDGPSSVTTPQMLDVLKNNHVHATFFMLGSRMEYNQDIVKRAFAEGNDVASHSYSHPNLAKQSIESLSFQINRTNEIFKSITGSDIKYVRPPYGSINDFVKNNVNMPLILWNVDPRDWESRNSESIVNYILENVTDGSFFVMHDIYQSTVDAMNILLPELYARGYQVVSFSEATSITGKEILPNNIYKNFR